MTSPVRHCARELSDSPIELGRQRQPLQIDFVEGVATALTPMALYETIMVRGYETLIAQDTTVDVKTAMLAAGRLQAMVESRAGELSMAEGMVQMCRVIEAVRSTVPESMWPEIRRRLEGDDDAAEPPEEEDSDGFEPDDDPLEPDDDFDELED